MARDVSWEMVLRRQVTSGIVPGLDRIRLALEEEGLSAPPHLVVLVAGTHGKGTTAAILSSLLELLGVRVGLFTSPHLIFLEERFRVSGKVLAHEVVSSRCFELSARYPELTFYELTLLVATSLFADFSVDVGVYEIGLGGRLDAANALEPDLSVLTSMGFDHQAWLGDSLEEICREKFGIVRRCVPVVIAPQEHDHAVHIFEELLCALGHEGSLIFTKTPQPLSWHGQVAADAARLLSHRLDYSFTDLECSLTEAVSRLCWPGRLQEIPFGQGVLLLDGAHSPDSMARLLLMFREGKLETPVAVFFGCLEDRMEEGMLQPLVSLGLPVYCASTPERRGVLGSTLVSALRERGLSEVHLFSDDLSDSTSFSPLHELFGSILQDGGKLLVCGSLYLVGAVLRSFDPGVEDLSIF